MAASDVDLPDPVEPTTSTRPRLVITMSFRISGSDSVAKLGISDGIVRITMPVCCCCMNALTRNRATPGIDTAKLHSSSLANSSRCRWFIKDKVSCLATAELSFCGAMGSILPCAFMVGGKSADMNKSDPAARLIAVSNLIM
jgi:hypothetical protein